VASGVGVYVIGQTAVLAAWADTLPSALIQAYVNNPQLNSQRAVVRATDEDVPQALSGYKPRATATASIGQQYTSTVTPSAGPPSPNYTRTGIGYTPSSVGVTVSQTLYNGLQTANRARQAETNTSVARETLRVTEQTILLLQVVTWRRQIETKCLRPVKRHSRQRLNILLGIRCIVVVTGMDRVAWTVDGG
jgi:outer membrane protein